MRGIIMIKVTVWVEVKIQVRGRFRVDLRLNLG